MVHCDFCGYDFDPTCTTSGCSSCPLVSSCGKYSCPRCGYEILPEARLIGWMRKIMKKSRGVSGQVSPERR